MKRISDKKRLQIEAEYPIRIELCKRCGGEWVETGAFKGYCPGGYCEVCHQYKSFLHPHETVHRSQGGKLSLENSKMLCLKCHNKEHGMEVK